MVKVSRNLKEFTVMIGGTPWNHPALFQMFKFEFQSIVDTIWRLPKLFIAILALSSKQKVFCLPKIIF
jgi:hypothetical protein